MQGTIVEGNPVNLAHVHTQIVPENHADARVASIPKDHIDVGAILAFEDHIDEVTLILENHVDDETVHVCTGMLTGVQIPQRNVVPTTHLWTP